VLSFHIVCNNCTTIYAGPFSLDNSGGSRSLTHQSTLALVHAFVTSCIDCYCALQAGLPLVPLLGWIEVFVRRPVLLGGCSFLPSLRWSPVVSFNVPSLTFVTSAALCWSWQSVPWVLHSAARCELLVPQARLAIMQRRAYSFVGPSALNDLPFELRSLLMTQPSKFYISLKCFFFGRDWAGSASE